MIKYLFILINSLGLFLYSLFMGDGGVTITNNIPKNIQPGQEIPVEIRIVKGNMSGFAKMQMEVPEGFTITDVENKGSSFTFVEGIAKWVWASLPADNELVLKCKIKTESTVSGAKTITGKYSFVENNAKQVVEMTPAEVTVGSGDVAENNSSTTNTTTTETPTTTASTNTVSDQTAQTTQTTSTQNQSASNNEPSSNVVLERTIVKGSSGNDFTVNIKITKGLTKGFARYSDDLPAGVTARAEKTEGASFSVADGKVKFVWVAVPEKEILELSYTIVGVKKMVLYGEYSYLEQNQSKKVVLTPETIESSEPVATNTPTETPVNNTNTNATNTTVAQNNSSNNTNNTNTSGNDNNTQTNQTNNNQTTETATQRTGNVAYMVQIGAFTSGDVTASKLASKFNISEKIKSEMQGGYSKFMVGDHTEYKNARDHRERVRSANGVATAFVVAYNSGKRITVQEALMVSNQKWFK